MNTQSQKILKISARKSRKVESRICQGDVFEGIEVIETFEVIGSKISVHKIAFPYVVCLNQECDLENDFKYNRPPAKAKDSCLLHLAIAPAFIFAQFLTGKHWGGDIFSDSNPQKALDTKIKLLIDNEIPRYHYLKFPEPEMPDLVIDFKHFFTINRDLLYRNLPRRLCSLDDLFREKVSQRFSYYISRIGLPENFES